ncbi:MAG: PQQ-dependent sugar dehydrogenase [Gemmatimonadaceae bacterium]|nr:PQQ-dependent sugar dehydrogenase [Gemmatimonadaceae bacterium]
MSSRLRSLLALVTLAAAPVIATAQGNAMHSMHHQFRLVKVVDSLVVPWSMAFLPNGDMLVTERPGRLRIVRGGKLMPTPVAGVPEVVSGNQAGLLDVVLHPRFAQNRLVYISYSKPESGGARNTTAVIRARFENDRLNDVQEIFQANAWSQGRGHYGSRLAFDRDGYLFITVGDRQVPPQGDLDALMAHPAQGLMTHHGKVIRLHDDGRVPADNPFVGRSDALPEIYSYGHRNLQGLIVHPVTNQVWETEHGPQGGDELNLIEAGKNYGWPVIGFGVNYRTGTQIHPSTVREGMEQPVKVWVPSIATSGLMAYTGNRFPGWQGSVFSGGLNGQQLVRIKLDGNRVVEEEIVLRDQGRIRDVRQGLDGLVYIAVEDRGGAPTAIWRLEPVGR